MDILMFSNSTKGIQTAFWKTTWNGNSGIFNSTKGNPTPLLPPYPPPTPTLGLYLHTLPTYSAYTYRLNLRFVPNSLNSFLYVCWRILHKTNIASKHTETTLGNLTQHQRILIWSNKKIPESEITFILMIHPLQPDTLPVNPRYFRPEKLWILTR